MIHDRRFFPGGQWQSIFDEAMQKLVFVLNQAVSTAPIMDPKVREL